MLLVALIVFQFRFNKRNSASTSEHRTAVKVSPTGVVCKQSREEKSAILQ